jgi:hypothetical protein
VYAGNCPSENAGPPDLSRTGGSKHWVSWRIALDSNAVETRSRMLYSEIKAERPIVLNRCRLPSEILKKHGYGISKSVRAKIAP